jgi:hypothetical protein
MDLKVDGREARIAQPIRFGGNVGDGVASPSPVADLRRFRLEHALKAVENALVLLDQERDTGVELSALERVRDDLEIVLSIARSDCR